MKLAKIFKKHKTRELSSLELSAVLLSGLFGALSTIVLVEGFELISDVLWGDFFGVDPEAPTRSIAAPAVIILAGLIIGLIIKKYGQPMKGLNETIQNISQKGYVRWQDAPKTLLISLFSISSGASLGPEAPSTVSSAGFSSYLGDKMKSKTPLRKTMGLSSLIGMIGGFFVLIIYSDGGFELPSAVGSVAVLPAAFLIGLTAAITAVIPGFIMYKLEPFISKLDNKPVQRALLGSAVVAAIVFVAPITMFSGQHVLGDLSEKSQSLAFLSLIALALAKLFSTQMLLRTGFFGGPIFPALFAGAAIGLAGTQVLDGASTVAIAASLSGMLTITAKKPIIAGLIAIAFTNTTAIPAAILGVAGGMIIQYIISRYRINILDMQ